jgi:RNA polymerase sigma-70 factor (ECF subfamily)
MVDDSFPSQVGGRVTPSSTPDGSVPDRHESPDALEDCLRQAVAGDESAFTRLYAALAPKLLRYATVLVGQDADDVAAEAWLQIARDMRAFSGDLDAFRGWTARIVRNRAIDLARARTRRPALPSGLHGTSDVFERADPDDAWDGADERISTERAIALIATLPQEQAEAVVLRAVIGLDAAGAGAILGKRPGAVRVAAHRGLQRLAGQIAERPKVTSPRA